jgi:hypothetical protein
MAAERQHGPRLARALRRAAEPQLHGPRRGAPPHATPPRVWGDAEVHLRHARARVRSSPRGGALIPPHPLFAASVSLSLERDGYLYEKDTPSHGQSLTAQDQACAQSGSAARSLGARRRRGSHRRYKNGRSAAAAAPCSPRRASPASLPEDCLAEGGAAIISPCTATGCHPQAFLRYIRSR